MRLRYVDHRLVIICFSHFLIFQLLLLHYKAAVNLADNDGNTPLHLCTANGHEDVSDSKFSICFLTWCGIPTHNIRNPPKTILKRNEINIPYFLNLSLCGKNE